VDRWPARVYLGVGTHETSRQESDDETVRNVLKLESTLRRAGLGPRRLRTVVEEGATHSEGAWAARFPDAIEFLYKE
jgi:predicted alpha/beta superfamily hydrolase